MAEFLHNDFHFDALLYFVLFRQLYLQLASGFMETDNTEKRDTCAMIRKIEAYISDLVLVDSALQLIYEEFLPELTMWQGIKI